jgi:hypothetical protein
MFRTSSKNDGGLSPLADAMDMQARDGRDWYENSWTSPRPGIQCTIRTSAADIEIKARAGPCASDAARQSIVEFHRADALLKAMSEAGE